MRGDAAWIAQVIGSSMPPRQLSFLETGASPPPGFRYQADLLSPDEEHELVEQFAHLPFRAFEFHGYLGKRRVLSFGWQYDFNTSELREAEPMPAFLAPGRQRAAAFAGLPPSALQHVLLTEYAAGAGIGWHRDKAVFGDVVGISLLSPCTFRFRRKARGSWERSSFVAEPRSAYLLQGPARTEWEHSIQAVDSLRYSITFRTFKQA
jgi:alkylated DNA repair dioxygenase AlkB